MCRLHIEVVTSDNCRRLSLMSELEVMLLDRGVTVDILEFAKKQPDTVGGPDVCPPKKTARSF